MSNFIYPNRGSGRIVRLAVPLLLFTVFAFSVFAQSDSSRPEAALALEREGKLSQAVEAWREVVKSSPRNAAAWASLGVDLSHLQQYREASESYRKALAIDPKLPGIQLNLGLAEFKSNNFVAAIPPFRAALSEDPKNMQARTLLGLSYYGSGKFPDAVKHLSIASAADPINAELHNVLAQSCLSAKNYDCAKREYSWILKNTPESSSSHMLLGEAMDGLGKTPEAIAEFEAAAKADSHAPNVHFGLGYLYWKLRRYDAAAAAFEAELANDPKNAQTLAYLGDVELKRENPDKALPLLEQAVAIREDLRIAQLDRGVLLTQKKAYPEALTALKRAEQLDPGNPEVHYRLARLYQATGDVPMAQKEFAKVQQLHRKSEEDMADQMTGAKTGNRPPSR